MNLEKIRVWDSSAKKNVWSRPDKYFDWRMYTLDRLSDMGFLGHLIGDMDGEKLREIDDVGLKTGIQVEIGQVARLGGRRAVTTPVPTGNGATTRQATTGNGAGASNLGQLTNVEHTDRVYTIGEIKKLSWNFVRQTLMKGPIMTELRAFRVADANVLAGILELDGRFLPNDELTKMRCLLITLIGFGT